tara:strand:+ start:260 stop:550 length:291 start_codon:yes stop_codon:yes gene_type:complete
VIILMTSVTMADASVDAHEAGNHGSVHLHLSDHESHSFDAAQDLEHDPSDHVHYCAFATSEASGISLLNLKTVNSTPCATRSVSISFGPPVPPPNA